MLRAYNGINIVCVFHSVGGTRRFDSTLGVLLLRVLLTLPVGPEYVGLGKVVIVNADAAAGHDVDDIIIGTHVFYYCLRFFFFVVFLAIKRYEIFRLEIDGDMIQLQHDYSIDNIHNILR